MRVVLAQGGAMVLWSFRLVWSVSFRSVWFLGPMGPVALWVPTDDDAGPVEALGAGYPLVTHGVDSLAHSSTLSYLDWPWHMLAACFHATASTN